MKLRMSLTWKIALLAVLTLLMLSSVLLIFAGVQFRISAGNFIAGLLQNRISSVAFEFGQELAETPTASRAELLDRYSKEYGVNFYLLESNGQSLTNTSLTLPDEVRAEMNQLNQRFRQ